MGEFKIGNVIGLSKVKKIVNVEGGFPLFKGNLLYNQVLINFKYNLIYEKTPSLLQVKVRLRLLVRGIIPKFFFVQAISPLTELPEV